MMLTKEELTAAILASAAKLGKTPTRGELMALSGATPAQREEAFWQLSERHGGLRPGNQWGRAKK